MRSSSTCYHNNGIGYTGRVNRTITGAKCRPWFENHYINNITYPTLVSNYCHNTQGLHPKPWCYTSIDRREWDYCPLEKCPDGIVNPIIFLSKF